MNRSYQCSLCQEKRSKDISIHKFPHDRKLCSAWMKICGLVDVANAKKSRLKPNAVPSKNFKGLHGLQNVPAIRTHNKRILNLPESLLAAVQSNSSIPSASCSTEMENEDLRDHSFSKDYGENDKIRMQDTLDLPCNVNDVELTDFQIDGRGIQVLKMVKNKFSEQQKQIQYFQKKSYNLKQRLKALHDLINLLLKKKLIENNAANNLMVYTDSLLEIFF
ncbi:uncharacterized protein [Prorops nasuta]|uniref:uncharacterized protein isoform X2 n=1 Tax=Prorops nasuta TaxID=863751 RepID=UPI0034CE7122